MTTPSVTTTSVTPRRSIIGVRRTSTSIASVIVKPPPLPEEVVTMAIQDDETESTDSSVSSLSQEGDDQGNPSTTPCPQSPLKSRSIFGSYWQQAEGGDSPSSRTKIVVPPTRALSPKSVMASNNPSMAHHQFKELQLLFGLLEMPMDENDANDDDLTINTYERVLKDCEQSLPPPPTLPQHASRLSPYYSHNPPLWTSWFLGNYHRHSEPSLRTQQHSQGRTISRSRQTQSDSALLPTPMGSALRTGRFSHSRSTTTPPTASINPTPCPKEAIIRERRHVRFQARIQVHSYQVPVESWAAEGWSQWFGI